MSAGIKWFGRLHPDRAVGEGHRACFQEPLGKDAEAWEARRLERKMTKREILESYFNTISYGNQCQGVESASRAISEFTHQIFPLAQAAYLSGIPKSPVRYDPYRNPDQAGRRQKDILSALQTKGWVDAENIRRALEEPIRLKALDTSRVAPHFLMFLNARYQGKKESLVTTLDLSLQRDLQGLLATQLRHLKANHVTNGAILVGECSSFPSAGVGTRTAGSRQTRPGRSGEGKNT